MRTALLALLAIGCAGGEVIDSSTVASGEDFLEEGERDGTLPPPTAITLEGPDFVAVNQRFELTVPDALSEETIYVISAGGEGEGPCPRPLGGYCMDLTRPVNFAGIAFTDGAGRAMSEHVAPRFPGARTCFQAVIARGPGGIHSALSNVLCVDFCADADADSDGICDAFDVCTGAAEVDTDGDGICDDIDSCPGGPDGFDTDDDGVCDALDLCEGFPDDVDSDGDGMPDGCDVVAPECESYTELNDAVRNVAYGPSGSGCDTDKIGWYRYTGAAGSRMADTRTPENYCDTHATGWYNGGYPGMGDTLFGQQVCFAWSGSECMWSQFIDITNCGDFYVYNLSGITWGCNGRYCGTD